MKKRGGSLTLDITIVIRIHIWKYLSRGRRHVAEPRKYYLIFSTCFLFLLYCKASQASNGLVCSCFLTPKNLIQFQYYPKFHPAHRSFWHARIVNTQSGMLKH